MNPFLQCPRETSNREKKGEAETEGKKEAANMVMNFTPNLSIVALSVNHLNIQVKRLRLSENFAHQTVLNYLL
jgi:hypothetical protein